MECFSVTPGGAGFSAVHRTLKRESFPLRLGELDQVVGALEDSAFDGIMDEDFSSRWEDCWVFLSMSFCNILHSCRGVPQGLKAAISTLRACVQRTLRHDMPIPRTAEAVEKELSARFVSYTGEEVARMEPLCLERILPALPPANHGGTIPVVDWTKGRTRTFLLKLELCVVRDEGQLLPRLQAKVHVEVDDRLKVALALCERGVCDWVETSGVFTFRDEPVLNGMFGVAKSSTVASGRTVLRVIMNLIPSNATLQQLQGSVQNLPGVCQYLSVVLDSRETLRMHQSDMTLFLFICLVCRPNGDVFSASI